MIMKKIIFSVIIIVVVTYNICYAYAPTGLTNNTAADADACLDTGVLITWTADAADWGDGGAGTRYYDVLRNGTAIKTSVAYLTTKYTDTSGSNGVTYTYTVKYRNGLNEWSVTSPGADAADLVAAVPSVLSNNTAVDVDTCADTGVQIGWAVDPANWNDNNVNVGMRTYDVLRNSVLIASGLVYGTTNFIDTLGTNSIIYTYTVRYNNGCGLSSAIASFSIPRAYHTSVINNGYLYVIGGYNGGYLNDVQFASINVNGKVGAWIGTNSFTTARYGHTSVINNGYLYVIGGLSIGYLNDVQFAPINADGTVGAWSVTNSFPTARYGHTSVVYNGYLYVIGGYNGTYLNDVRFAPINANGTVGTWSATSSFPTARGAHASVVYNGYLYVIGGNSSIGYLNDVQFAPINVDGTVGAWSATTNFPTPRYYHTSVAYNGYLYVTGGNSSTGYLNDVQFAPINADGTVGAWSATTSFLPARYGHTSVINNSYLYVIGGYNGTYLNNNQFALINANGTIGAWDVASGANAADLVGFVRGKGILIPGATAVLDTISFCLKDAADVYGYFSFPSSVSGNACNSSIRDVTTLVFSGVGVADYISFCAKDTTDNYFYAYFPASYSADVCLVANRGVSTLIFGGAGVADKIRFCGKTTADVYRYAYFP